MLFSVVMAIYMICVIMPNHIYIWLLVVSRNKKKKKRRKSYIKEMSVIFATVKLATFILLFVHVNKIMNFLTTTTKRSCLLYPSLPPDFFYSPSLIFTHPLP